MNFLDQSNLDEGSPNLYKDEKNTSQNFLAFPGKQEDDQNSAIEEERAEIENFTMNCSI